MAEKKAKTEPRPEYRPRPQTLLKYVQQALEDSGLELENTVERLTEYLEEQIVFRATGGTPTYPEK